jgi:hypothetical protein
LIVLAVNRVNPLDTIKDRAGPAIAHKHCLPLPVCHAILTQYGTPVEGTDMKRETAQSVLALMFDYGGKLNDAMLKVRETSDQEEFARYRRAFGNVLESAFEQIINPILEEHPDLKPDQLNLEARKSE